MHYFAEVHLALTDYIFFKPVKVRLWPVDFHSVKIAIAPSTASPEQLRLKRIRYDQNNKDVGFVVQTKRLINESLFLCAGV